MTGVVALLGALCVFLTLKVLILEHDINSLSDFVMFLADDQGKAQDHISTLYSEIIKDHKSK